MAQNYTVRERQRTTILFAGSEPRAGYRVWFEVPATNTFDYVEIAETEDRKEVIQARIEEKVKKILDTFS